MKNKVISFASNIEIDQFLVKINFQCLIKSQNSSDTKLKFRMTDFRAKSTFIDSRPKLKLGLTFCPPKSEKSIDFRPKQKLVDSQSSNLVPNSPSGFDYKLKLLST